MLSSLRGAVVRRRGASRPHWRRLVVGLVAGSGAPEMRVGIGGNPCRLGRHRHGGACGCHLTFREGVGGYPSSRLVVYRGKPLAAMSSSSCPFLEVLIGTGASESRSLVGDLQWTQRSRGFVVFVDPPLSAFVSFLFLFHFFWACLWCFRSSSYRWSYWMVAS